MTPAVNKNALNVSKIFETYITFLGDCDKTAVACDISPDEVRGLASAENWPAKVVEWNKLREGDPREVQIQINRAVNYVQAHRLRSIIDKVVGELTGKEGTEIVDLLTTHGKTGSSFSARPLTDLVKAAESCQLMTARALGDTASERPEGEGEAKGSSIALQVLAAMNAADAVGLDSVQVVKRQLESESPPRVLKSAN